MAIKPYSPQLVQQALTLAKWAEQQQQAINATNFPNEEARQTRQAGMDVIADGVEYIQTSLMLMDKMLPFLRRLHDNLEIEGALYMDTELVVNKPMREELSDILKNFDTNE